jgi:hypothetical protein
MPRSLPVLFLLIASPLLAAEPVRKLVLVEGKFGKALDAKATPTSVAGHERYRKPPFTIECWAKLSGKDHFNVLVASDPKNSARHWELYTYAGSGNLSAYFPGYEPAEVRSTHNVADGKWHFLVMTFDGTTVTLFADGKQVARQEIKPRGGLKPVEGPLTFGQANAPDHHVGCDGLIDNVRISDVVREVTGVPAKELPHDEHTVGQWRFDAEEGLVVGPGWTPPPVLGGLAEPWEKFTDADWIDPRFRRTDTGPFLGATFEYPAPKGKARAFKGLAVRVGAQGEAAVIFDRNQLRLAAGWNGGYLNHSDRRFGLLNTPTPAGNMVTSTSGQPGWACPLEALDAPLGPATAPLPRGWAHYQGLYRHGKRTVIAYTVGNAEVLESPWVENDNGLSLITRTLEVGRTEIPLGMLAAEFSGPVKEATVGGQKLFAVRLGGTWHVLGFTGDAIPKVQGNRVWLGLAPSNKPLRLKLFLGTTTTETLDDVAKLIKASPPPDDVRGWMKPGPALWKETLVTRGEVAADDGQPFVIDTLTVPYDNPYKALFFITALDFLPDGTIAVCTAHGDVWLVRGADAKLEKLTWKRFATGLYQPLGLKVVDGKIVVLERGQLTRLHDTNNDGEADFYENLNNDWHCAGGEHSYDTCLETDPQGNFYFFKTGDHETLHGGCLMRVSNDGKTSEVFASGFRHPIGLGMSPAGVLSGADQEGNWMPATRIDLYQKGGFYGDLRTHHRATPPKTYDPPLLWLPREADNSAGGQVWVPEGTWSPLAGKMLHLSYGRCRMLLVLPQKLGEVMQAGAVDCGLTFLSGVKSGRFGPDGHLYVVGLNGWQTAARRDGCLQRVCFTGKPVRLPTSLAVHKDGVRLGFAEPLDRTSAEDAAAWKVEQWNYRWSADYGSRHWSVAEPDKEAHDPLPVTSAQLTEDGKSVFLKVNGLRPVMQMQITYALKSADGAKVTGKVFNTIHALEK